MKKLNLLLSIVILSITLFSCIKDQEDKEKIVEMTIYAETGYGGSFMSDLWTEPLVFSDSDDPSKRQLTDIIVDNFEIDYERGYEYKFEAKKIWMQNPPQDVSSVKYVIIKSVSKTKVITEDSEQNVQLLIAPETVPFTPKYPNELDGDGKLKVYDALRVNEVGTNNWLALKNIEGFNFEAGYEYVIDAKKVTTAEPYSVKYVLVSVISKTAKP